MKSDVFTFGRVRASWAQVGSGSRPFLTTEGYNAFNTNYNGQGYASVYNQLPEFDLKNELTETIEVGFNVRMFKNRFGLDVSYYDGSTKNQIIPITVSNASGFERSVINAGEIANSGLEVVFDASIFKNSDGFNWDIMFNYSSNKSEVVSLAPGIETYLMVNSFPNDVEARVGEPINTCELLKEEESLPKEVTIKESLN